MFCSKCGKEIPDNSTFCPECGNAAGSTTEQPVNINQNSSNYGQPPVQDEPNTIVNIASCCFPIVGFILYFVWKDSKPRSANSVCKWTIGGVIGGIVIYAILFVLGLAGSLFGM